MGLAEAEGGGNAVPAVPQPVTYGDYFLLHRVAIGGMAELFLAQSRRADVHDPTEPIALKRILPHMAEDPEFRRMFIDEAKIASRLDHPNIVPIRRLGTVEESLFIAMEFVWGKDLLQIINRFRRSGRRIPAGLAAFVAYNMCGALAYAHDKLDPQGRPLHLVHRDVSPQNVLVGYDGSVKLIDFGIARAATRQTKTQTGVLKGKFGYMSPEQVRGLPIDHRSDLFAVGTCLWEMLTSERLFAAESDFATLERVRNAQVDPPSARVTSIPKDLEAIVMHALACEREERFQSARELRMALQSFLRSEPVPFDVSRLSTWMHHLFAEEIEKERPLTTTFFGRVAPDGPNGPSSETRAREPMIFRPPQEAPSHRRAALGAGREPDPSPFDELADEPTNIFRGDELEALAAEDSVPAFDLPVGASALAWDAPGPEALPPPPAQAPVRRSVPPPPPPPAALRAPPRTPLPAAERGTPPLDLRMEPHGLAPSWADRWLGTPERRWLVSAGIAGLLVLAMMLAAILGT